MNKGILLVLGAVAVLGILLVSGAFDGKKTPSADVNTTEQQVVDTEEQKDTDALSNNSDDRKLADTEENIENTPSDNAQEQANAEQSEEKTPGV